MYQLMWIFTPDGFISLTRPYVDGIPKDDLYLVSSKFRGQIETMFPQYQGKVHHNPDNDIPYSAEILFFEAQDYIGDMTDVEGMVDLHEHPDIRTHEYRAFLTHVYTEIMVHDWEAGPHSWRLNLPNLSSK